MVVGALLRREGVEESGWREGRVTTFAGLGMTTILFRTGNTEYAYVDSKRSEYVTAVSCISVSVVLAVIYEQSMTFQQNKLSQRTLPAPCSAYSPSCLT